LLLLLLPLLPPPSLLLLLLLLLLLHRCRLVALISSSMVDLKDAMLYGLR
jgi:hypothetical protein